MRIISMHILKYVQEDSIFLTSAYELSFVSFFKRTLFKQSLNFAARICTNRAEMSRPLALIIPQVQAKAYVYINKNKIACVIIADDQYPEYLSFQIIRRLLKQFEILYSVEKLNQFVGDQKLNFPVMQEYLKKYQDPKEVDKLQKLKENIKQLEAIVHKNLQDVLKRGQTLQRLLEKSKDVSNLSLDIFKTSKKVNKRCCSLY